MFSSGPKALLFIRRSDLDSSTRLKIASIALFFAPHGTISSLSRKYKVSRQFIYDLRDQLSSQLEYLFGPRVQSTKGCKKNLLRIILHLGLIGCCSLWKISTLLEELGLGKACVSGISQDFKKIGSTLPDTLSGHGQVIYLSDEIYAPDPILVTVEAQSMAILRIEKAKDLRAQCWEDHWRAIQAQGYKASTLVKDEGAAMNKASQACFGQDTRIQSDTFHAISYRLGRWAERLERLALQAIHKEYEQQAIWERSQTYHWAATQQKHQDKYEDLKAIALIKSAKNTVF